MSAAQTPWCNTLVREPGRVSLSDQTLTGAGAWLHSPYRLLLGVLCCPVRPGGRPRWLCEGHLRRRRLSRARGSRLAPRRNVPPLESPSLSVCVLHLPFPPQTTNAELFFFFFSFFNGLRQLLKIQTSLVKIHATSSQEAPTAGRLGRISSVKTLRFWCKILFRSSRIVEGIMKRLFWKSVEERINMSAGVLHFRHVFCFPCFVSLCSPSAAFKNTSPAVQTLLFPLCAILDSHCAFHCSLLIYHGRFHAQNMWQQVYIKSANNTLIWSNLNCARQCLCFVIRHEYYLVIYGETNHLKVGQVMPQCKIDLFLMKVSFY